MAAIDAGKLISGWLPTMQTRDAILRYYIAALRPTRWSTGIPQAHLLLYHNFKSTVIYIRACFLFFCISLLFIYFFVYFFCAFYFFPNKYSSIIVDQVCLVWFHARTIPVLSEPCLHITSRSARLPSSTGIPT